MADKIPRSFPIDSLIIAYFITLAGRYIERYLWIYVCFLLLLPEMSVGISHISKKEFNL